MSLFGFYFHREKSGVISQDACWVCMYHGYLHTAKSLVGLLWNVMTEFKHDRHLCG